MGCYILLTLNSNTNINLKKKRGSVGGVLHFQEESAFALLSACQYIPFPFLPLLIFAVHHFLYYFCTKWSYQLEVQNKD